MQSDQEIYTLLGADAEILAILTGGIEVKGPYHFEALEVKGLDRRTDGVLLPDDPEQPIWVVEFQAKTDRTIYYRLVVEMGLVGERHPGRVVRGLILFATAGIDPKTSPWHEAAQQANPPLRVAYLKDIVDGLVRETPEHPLLAVLLPFRVADRERLRREGAQALARIAGASLPSPLRDRLLDVFWSWMTVRFNDMSYREILAMFGNLTPLEETRTYQELVAIGKEKGREEGRQEGRRAEALSLIQRLARRRFGSLPVELHGHLEGLPLERLEALAEAILDLRTLTELREWLAQG